MFSHLPPSKLRLFALGRMKSGVMNKTEQRFANTLETLKQANEVLWYRFAPLSIKLAEKTFYRPDFMVLRKDYVIEIIDIKGSKGVIQDDSHAKIKIAADIYPFRFLLAFPQKGGTWKLEEV